MDADLFADYGALISKTSTIAEFSGNLASVEALRLEKKSTITINEVFRYTYKLKDKQTESI